MTRDPAPEVPTDTREPSKALAGIAAALPLVLSTGCCLLVPWVGAGGPDEAVAFAEQTGIAFYLIMLAAPFAGIVAGALIGVAGTGRRVPTALALFAAALPWLIGLAGHRYGMYMVEQALSFADPSSRAPMIAQGYAESSGALLYGAGVASGTLLGTSLGLAIAALGQRAPDRSLLGAGIALLALPFLGAGGWLMTVSPMAASTPIAVALGATIAAGLAGAAVGSDAPKHRSAALAVGAVAAGSLAFVAAAAAAATAARMEVFSALAMVSPDARMEVLVAAAEELAPATAVARWGIVLGVVPLLALVGLSATRSKVSAGMVIGGVVSALVVLLVVGLDEYIVRAAPAGLAELARPPWRDHPSFEPVPLDGADGGMETPPAVHALVLEGNLVPLAGQPSVPIGAGAEAVTASLHQLVSPAGGDLDEPPPQTGLLGMLGQVEGAETLPSAEPSLSLAFDRRTDHATLSRVIESAEAAGAKSIWWTGLPGDVSPEGRAAVAAQLPLVAAMIEQPVSVKVRLPSSLPMAFVAADPESYRGTIEAGATELTLTPRPTSSRAPLRLAPDDLGGRVDFAQEPIAYLRVAPGASAADVSRFVGLAKARGFTPALYLGELPPADAAAGVLGLLQGNPDAVAEAEETLEALLGNGGVIGLADLGGIGSSGGTPTMRPPSDDRPTPRVRTGSSAVQGSLSPEVIRRVIRRHINEARYCYERALAQSPNLAGRVTVSFVVGASGSVTSATVDGSTLGNESVESCLVAAVRRWTFPAPEGGGEVRVAYPFQFEAAN